MWDQLSVIQVSFNIIAEWFPSWDYQTMATQFEQVIIWLDMLDDVYILEGYNMIYEHLRDYPIVARLM